MKTPQYLSPTGLSKWKEDQTQFYLNYLSDNRPPRYPQTNAMAIGSSFDAYCKSYLHERLFGAGNDPRYSFEALYEAQVESQWRDWALDHGKYVFEQYKSCGAMADLMTELRQAEGTPRFEFEVKGAVNGYREPVSKKLGEVVLLGKPDVHFINAQGAHVIIDWKVNGYCSRNPPSPMPGYLRMRSANKTQHGMHKNCQPMSHKGVQINIATHLDYLNEDWGRQLTIYAWLMGEPIGSDFIVGIDQIVCDATRGQLPSIRVAEHRLTTSKKYQESLFTYACEVWEIIHSDWIFRDMTREESQGRCVGLDTIKEVLEGDGTSDSDWFTSVCS